MKKTVLWSAVLAMFIFGGCSSKEPSIDATGETGSKSGQSVDGTSIVTETVAEEDIVVVDENGVSNIDEDGNEKTMSALERRMQTINFAFDKFDVAGAEADKMMINSDLANGDAADFTVKIEGNCDEWGSDEYNFALGLKRASAAKEALISNGVDSARITMVSYGESNPVCTDKTQACWSENRRVDFKLLP